MGRLSGDKRFDAAVDYLQDFEPNPCRVTVHEPDLAVAEVAALICAVAGHAVLLDGQYLAGSPADKYRHRR